MSYKIQIIVDKELNDSIKDRAHHMGLSVSSYARLALMNSVPKKGNGLLNDAIEDVKFNNVESLTLAEFNQQIDDLL